MREYMKEFLFLVSCLLQNDEIDAPYKKALLKIAATELDVYPVETIKKLNEVKKWSVFKSQIDNFIEKENVLWNLVEY